MTKFLCISREENRRNFIFQTLLRSLTKIRLHLDSTAANLRLREGCPLDLLGDA